MSTVQALGLVVNMKKSILVPGQSIEFLGFLVNSLTDDLVDDVIDMDNV